MTRGNAPVSKVHYRGKNDDFVVMVENAQIVRDWIKDRTIPMAEVVNGFKIFVTHKHGAQGVLDTASKGSLEDEFGTTNEDDIIKTILERGDVQESENSARGGDRNDSKGTRGATHG